MQALLWIRDIIHALISWNCESLTRSLAKSSHESNVSHHTSPFQVLLNFRSNSISDIHVCKKPTSLISGLIASKYLANKVNPRKKSHVIKFTEVPL